MPDPGDDSEPTRTGSDSSDQDDRRSGGDLPREPSRRDSHEHAVTASDSATGDAEEDGQHGQGRNRVRAHGRDREHEQHREDRQDQTGRRTRRAEESDDGGWLLFGRDLLVSISIVLLFGGYLFAISGVWPPMVAIESGSMEPNMERNDLVFVMDTDRFQPESATDETGVVVAHDGADVGYSQFGNPGDVIVFAPGGKEEQTPIIHRAMFWVEEGENWLDRADEEFLGGVDSCAQLSGCPAPHAGFITKGDDNQAYDQASAGRIGDPVRPEWVVGTAELRIPGAGWLRLQFG